MVQMNMDNPSSAPETDAELTRSSWFTRPLSLWACVLGWCLASGIFFACVAVPGGPAVGDAYLVIYPTWGFSHAEITCMYPPHPASIVTYAAPGYPLVAGGIGFLARIGSSAPFPSGSALG